MRTQRAARVRRLGAHAPLFALLALAMKVARVQVLGPKLVLRQLVGHQVAIHLGHAWLLHKDGANLRRRQSIVLSVGRPADRWRQISKQNRTKQKKKKTAPRRAHGSRLQIVQQSGGCATLLRTRSQCSALPRFGERDQPKPLADACLQIGVPRLPKLLFGDNAAGYQVVVQQFHLRVVGWRAQKGERCHGVQPKVYQADALDDAPLVR